MAQSLVVVESVAKTRTIHKILGTRYTVKASIGHIKDLPKKRLGVDIENGFEPEYTLIKGKGKTLRELRKLAARCEEVLVATDPDREGEAIAYHLAQEIQSQNKNIKRVLFNEITPSAVKEAVARPTEIDLDKVEAQKARRVMDRLVGYQISPLLWKTIFRGLSAGRVQSVALRLICEREDQIESFVPEEYWSITARLRGTQTDPFLAKLVKIDGKDPRIENEGIAQHYVDDLWKKVFIVDKITRKEVKRNPYPPFTTSTLQQDAARRFGFSAHRIMSIAQQLYEGVDLGSEGSVGLITYMRTDSTRIAKEALQAVREYIAVAFGQQYLPDKARIFKKKTKIQDAHEAIRPTNMKLEPKKIARYLSKDQLKIYQLIWNRFVASQMSAAIYQQTTIDITADEYLFRKSGSVVKFRGFLQIYEEALDREPNMENGEEEAMPRNLAVGEKLKLLDLIKKQHFTTPPPRYNESTLIKELDQLGIGRPSTYAQIITTLFNRRYVEKMERKLHPTELGRTVNTLLVGNFPDIFNVKFTAQMELELDQIESGNKTSRAVLQDFYLPFDTALKRVDAKRMEIKHSLQEKTDEICPDCGEGHLVVKWGRNGKFMACSRYPQCRFTRALDEQETPSDEKCEVCGANMVIRVGRFGRFLACSNYPECKNTRSISLNIACPRQDCGGSIVEKRSRRGKVFFGCSNYPDCDFATWYRPVKQSCPTCGHPYMESRASKARGEFLRCPVCKQELAIEAVPES